MYKCKICGKKYTDLSSLYNHIQQAHSDMIPMDMSVQQYYYYMKTGRSNGNCVMCKQPTTWNKNTNKYNRFCGDPKCKEEYVKIAKSRMIAKYGKVHLLNDPKKQREMLANRKISGVYRWSNSKIETTYTGSYELDFLKTLDLFFEWDPEDISMPSPHTYTYKYDGEEKFYIPDVFIHSLDLEIEIKDGGDNPNNHHKIQAVDKEKERLKDETMTSQKLFHYVKITNKNYTNFFDFLKEVKNGFEKYGDDKKIPRIFKIEDIKTKGNVKPIQESSEETLLEGKFLTNIVNSLQKMENKPLKEKDFIIRSSFNKRINSPKDLQEYISILIKNINSENDIVYVKNLVGESKTHYYKLINKLHKNVEGYDDYIKWVYCDMDKEIRERMREIKENFDLSINDEKEDVVANKLNMKILCSHNSRTAFSITDTNTQLIVNDRYILEKTKVGMEYIIKEGSYDCKDKQVLEFEISYNDDICLTESMNDKIQNGVNINSLCRINDNNSINRFIQEVSIKLFGLYPEDIN